MLCPIFAFAGMPSFLCMLAASCNFDGVEPYVIYSSGFGVMCIGQSASSSAVATLVSAQLCKVSHWHCVACKTVPCSIIWYWCAVWEAFGIQTFWWCDPAFSYARLAACWLIIAADLGCCGPVQESIVLDAHPSQPRPSD